MRITSQLHLAKRYAKALYDIAIEKKVVEVVLADMEGMNDFFFSEDENQVEAKAPKEQLKKLFDPLVTNDYSLLRIAKALWQNRVHFYTLKFMEYLAHKRRISLLPWIASAYCLYHQEKNGIGKMIVESSQKISPETIALTKIKMETLLKVQLVVVEKQDTSIIGGARFKVNDLVYDTTIKNALANLQKKFLKV